MPDPLSDAAAELARRLSAARAVVVLTGAGVSAESGLRTFRGASAGDLPADRRALWKDFDPRTLATPEAFASDPAGVSKWYDWRRLGCLAAQPNPGHLALARIERELAVRGALFTLLTQNVDRLHQRAGSRRVVELHGTIMTWRCTSTGRETDPGPEPMPCFPAPSPFAPGAWLRPNVVWFGEALPEAALAAADEGLRACDLFMSVGTSAQVYPAAAFAHHAAAHGAFTAEINAESTPISRAVDVTLRGKSGEWLPTIAALAFGA